MLVKELQGLSLKVDLISSNNEVIDAEEVLAESIKDEANHLSTVDVPEPEISDVDVTMDAIGDEFKLLELDDTVSDDSAVSISVSDDDQDDTYHSVTLLKTKPKTSWLPI